MADLFAPQQNTRAPRREAERLKTLAESLQKAGQPKGNEMVSGIVVKQSPLEHLARGLQTAAGGYFAGQAQNKEEEDERALQQRMADALSQWGDPQAAAGILAQDPRTSEMAFKLMMGEQDHTRAKELAQMRISAMGSGGGNMPASMQVAGKMFALEQAMDNPNLSEKERYLAAREYDLIGQAQKTYGFDKGLGYSGGLSGYNKFRGQSPSQDILGITPIDMMPNGEMSYPQMGGQTPEFPLMPDQYTTLGQNKEFNDLIGGLTGQPMQQDPVAAHAQAVALQQQQTGISPMQRPELRQPIGMSEIQGYGQAAAGIAAQKKAAEATAESNAKYMAEGRQRLPQAQRALQDAQRSSQNIMRVVDQVRNDAQGAFTTGFSGTIAGAVPGSPAYDLKQNLNTLRANAAFDTLQNMRNNSPTGGALGAVSEKELALLESAFTNLSNSQSHDQFMQNLQAFERQNQSSLGAMQRAYAEDYGRFGGASDQYLPAPQQNAAPVANPQRDQIMQTLRATGATQDEINAYLQARGL